MRDYESNVSQYVQCVYKSIKMVCEFNYSTILSIPSELIIAWFNKIESLLFHQLMIRLENVKNVLYRYYRTLNKTAKDIRLIISLFEVLWLLVND